MEYENYIVVAILHVHYTMWLCNILVKCVERVIWCRMCRFGILLFVVV